jgi:purine-nucleoside phosphorylase
MSASVAEAAEFLRPSLAEPPLVGLVLGSGLGSYSKGFEARVAVSYRDIPGFAASTVPGHAGELVSGRVRGVPVACLSGRVHLYEGHSVERVVLGVRVLAELGCRAVLLTNAAGGIRQGLSPGSLLLLADHVNLTGTSPLIGPNAPGRSRFPDMSEAYDPPLRALAHSTAKAEGIALEEGVYAGLVGPSYETPAEIRMLRTLGADAVGMSTVLEVIALRHLDVRVGAVSVITNLAAGLSGRPLDHAEVQAAGEAAKDRLERLLSGWVERFGRERAYG